MICSLLAASCVLAISAGGAPDPPRLALERRFADLLGTDDGCFVLHDVRRDRTLRVNPVQCRRRLPPCSTFKIFNSLAGLQSGVLKDENTRFAWDGAPQPFPAWERDHTLATAVRDSVVLYFQRVAAGVGEKAMQRYLDAAGYGNRDISGGLTRFWLGSSLRVSPDEQVVFLRRLYRGDLPFDQRHIDVVKKVLVQEEAGGVVFSGKTGTCEAGDGSRVGWFVGRQASPAADYVFATTVVGQSLPERPRGAGADGLRAREISRALLAELAAP